MDRPKGAIALFVAASPVAMSENSPKVHDALRLEPGRLWTRVTEQTAIALDRGALQSIPTNSEIVEENGIPFLVRILQNLARKEAAKREQQRKSEKIGKSFNPFLPYDRDLFVADLSETHLCLLNKFNVVDHHLLVVTREFEDQQELLTRRDFEAIGACLTEFPSLAFYNGGRVAGASQPHKHLQLVPLPLTPDSSTPLPIASAIARAEYDGEIGTVGDFPFVHAVGKLDPDWGKSPDEGAVEALQLYRKLLRAIGLKVEGSTGERQSGPYNWLATRDWMLVVGRSHECFESISVNSLGFAGALLVRNADQLARLKALGPMQVLAAVGRAPLS